MKKITQINKKAIPAPFDPLLKFCPSCSCILCINLQNQVYQLLPRSVLIW